MGDHPAFNSDLCDALPFSWHSASIEDRLTANSCRYRYPDAYSHMAFNGCTAASQVHALRTAPVGFDLQRLPCHTASPTDSESQRKERVQRIGCAECDAQWTDVDFFVERAAAHASRVTSPREARLLVVPFSLFRNVGVHPCPKHGHAAEVETGYETPQARTSRLAEAISALSLKLNRSIRDFFFIDTH